MLEQTLDGFGGRRDRNCIRRGGGEALGSVADDERQIEFAVSVARQ